MITEEQNRKEELRQLNNSLPPLTGAKSDNGISDMKEHRKIHPRAIDLARELFMREMDHNRKAKYNRIQHPQSLHSTRRRRLSHVQLEGLGTKESRNMTLQKVQDHIRVASYRLGKVDIKSMVTSRDHDHDGSLDLKEFTTLIRKELRMYNLSKKEMRMIFEHIDKDQLGTIEISELQQFLHESLNCADTVTDSDKSSNSIQTVDALYGKQETDRDVGYPDEKIEKSEKNQTPLLIPNMAEQNKKLSTKRKFQRTIISTKDATRFYLQYGNARGNRLKRMADYNSMLTKETEKFEDSWNPLKIYIDSVVSNNLVPLQLDISKLGIDISNLLLGDDFAIKAIIPSMKTQYVFNLKNNRLSSEFFAHFHNKWENEGFPNMQYLELSRNSFNDNAMMLLSENLKDMGGTSHKNTLKYLGLSKNRFSKNGCAQIIQSISENIHLIKSLLELDISHNDIGKSSCKDLCSYLTRKKCKLRCLNLSACNLHGRDGIAIFYSMANNESMLSLDLSWNNIFSEENATNEFCNFISNNKCLLHLNISGNIIGHYSMKKKQKISKQTMLKIDSAFLQNHVLLGIHANETGLYFDYHGYLSTNHENEDKTVNICAQDQHYQWFSVRADMEMQMEDFGKLCKSSPNNWSRSHCCWLCSEYNQFHFVLPSVDVSLPKNMEIGSLIFITIEILKIICNHFCVCV